MDREGVDVMCYEMVGPQMTFRFVFRLAHPYDKPRFTTTETVSPDFTVVTHYN